MHIYIYSNHIYNKRRIQEDFFMMNTSLISKQEVLKENFNSQEFVTKEDKEFLILYMQILNFACEIGAITTERKEEIASLILMEVVNQNENEILPTSNSLYAFSTWLNSMSNWEAFEELSRVVDSKTADTVINESENYFFKQIDKMLEKLREIQTIVGGLSVPNITKEFNYLFKQVMGLRNFRVPRTCINLKLMHEQTIFMNYAFLHEIKGIGVIEKLKNTVEAFSNEISILRKVGIDENFRNEEEAEIVRKALERYRKEVDMSKLLELKKSYEDEIHLAEIEEADLNNRIDELFQKYEAEHPELKEEELEKSFEDYMEKLPESFFKLERDRNEIEQRYNQLKNEALAEIETDEKAFDSEEEKRFERRGWIEAPITLSYALLEYTLVSLVKKGVMSYPETPEERGEILSRITAKNSIKEFLSNEESNLSEGEVLYLKSCL